MLYKARTEPVELRNLSFLNIRMSLSEKDMLHYININRGYEGEVMFDTYTEKLQSECLVLNDLLLQVNNTTFQIDSLIIFSETIFFYEIKNYEGDYYFESDRFYKKPKFEIINPLNQLSRSESLLRQLLHRLGFNIPIKAYIVFINPAFTSYQSPLNNALIFPTQILRHFEKLNSTSSKLNSNHLMLAEKLLSMHIQGSPFMQLPTYDYEQMQKGITCAKCNSLLISLEGRKCICRECGNQEIVETAVIRMVKELKLLFPKVKITTNLIHDWCKVIDSKERIRRILSKNLRILGVHQWSSYE